jgi:hypothetical protein
MGPTSSRLGTPDIEDGRHRMSALGHRLLTIFPVDEPPTLRIVCWLKRTNSTVHPKKDPALGLESGHGYGHPASSLGA